VGKDIPWWDHAYCFEQPILDLASGSFPTGLCQDPEIDLPPADFKPRSKLDAQVLDVPEEWRNGPIGLQITARRLEEEKVVDMLCKVKDALSK
jgi:amidase